MADLSEINPHLALWQSETAVDSSERAWLRWIAKVERPVGHDMDGDEAVDGYSLDFAYDVFSWGDYTPEEYIAEFYKGVGAPNKPEAA